MPIKLDYEYIKNYINQENTLISTEYINNKKLLKIKCNSCGVIYNQRFDSYKKGHRHRECDKRLFNRKKILKIKQCIYCSKDFQPSRTIQKLCNIECQKSYFKSDEFKYRMSNACVKLI